MYMYMQVLYGNQGCWLLDYAHVHVHCVCCIFINLEEGWEYSLSWPYVEKIKYMYSMSVTGVGYVIGLVQPGFWWHWLPEWCTTCYYSNVMDNVSIPFSSWLGVIGV